MNSVLLYSGGLDSVCAAYLHPYDVLLRVPTGAAYEQREALCCQQLGHIHPRLDGVVTTAPGMFDFSSITRPDGIVPNRNAHLVLAASLYGQHIALAAVDGDRSCDKDEGFAGYMQNVLDHMWQAQHWTTKRTFTVALPVKHMHKSRLLRLALHEGMPNAVLYTSYSCYTGNRRQCGVCKPCVRKYVAMRTCGVSIPNFLFVDNPSDAPWLPEALGACKSFSGWRCDAEDSDFLEVFK